MSDVNAGQKTELSHRGPRRGLRYVCLVYLGFSAIFGSVNLDIDEFSFIREPYELLGGDYTTGYLKQHNYGAAASTLAKSYWFYWKYRPLFYPVIAPEDKQLFAVQERDFGYVKPDRVAKQDRDSLQKYQQRLIVPEPDRFYSHAAGKPLLAAIASIPQLALIKVVTPAGKNLLYYQYRFNYHPIFILTRLVQILSGLATILLVYWILSRESDHRKALYGAALVAFFPISIKYFPNIHHDSMLVPFLVASTYFFYKQQYARAGLLLGLALAAKNTAVILIPVFIAYLIYSAWRTRNSDVPAENQGSPRDAVSGFATTMALALICILPFANPVSYASELLTPLTHRAYDSRGENVEQLKLTTKVATPAAQGAYSEIRPELRALQMLTRLQDNSFFFVVIAIGLFWSQRRSRLATMYFIVLMFALPYGLVFGSDLNYRSLLFVPFFAVVCADIVPRRLLFGLTAALLMIDAFYCFDPITTDGFHNPVNSETFWAALARSVTG